MNNAKIQSDINGSTVYNHTELSSSYVNMSSSRLHFYRSGHIVTCTYHLTGDGGAFALGSDGQVQFYKISTSAIPERYRPAEDVFEVVVDTSGYRTNNAALGIVHILPGGDISMELINKRTFNLYGTITYYVD